MTDILQKICNAKRASIETRKTSKPLEELKQQLNTTLPAPRFINAIKDNAKINKPSLIAEIKKASPSHGLIKKIFSPIEIANAYKNADATCLSILTEEDYFQGSDQFLIDVRSQNPCPVLRKDFTVDAYQIYESKIIGADCILLIVAALTDEELKHLYDLTKQVHIDALIEVHDEEELERALNIAPDMIGINNRNLKTLEISLETSFRLKEKIPKNIITVTESGIQNHEQLTNLHQAGFDAFLVGESLMREDNIEAATKKLLTGN